MERSFMNKQCTKAPPGVAPAGLFSKIMAKKLSVKEKVVSLLLE